MPNGKWGPPENLGSRINTRFNEETPFITEDGNTLFFSSYGHYNMGGYDIFRSSRGKNGSWSKPENLGYPINSTGNDVFLHPVHNGLAAYQARLEKDSRGRYDIFYMDIYSATHPRIYQVSGSVRAGDGRAEPGSIRLVLTDEATGDTLRKKVHVAGDGSIRVELPQGEYRFHASAPGYPTAIMPLRISSRSDKTGITLPKAIELDVVPPAPILAEMEDSLLRSEDNTRMAAADSGIQGEATERQATDPADTEATEAESASPEVLPPQEIEDSRDQVDDTAAGAEIAASESDEGKPDGRAGWIVLLAAGGILLLIFLWFRRKKKNA